MARARLNLARAILFNICDLSCLSIDMNSDTLLRDVQVILSRMKDIGI